MNHDRSAVRTGETVDGHGPRPSNGCGSTRASILCRTKIPGRGRTGSQPNRLVENAVQWPAQASGRADHALQYRASCLHAVRRDRHGNSVCRGAMRRRLPQGWRGGCQRADYDGEHRPRQRTGWQVLKGTRDSFLDWLGQQVWVPRTAPTQTCVDPGQTIKSNVPTDVIAWGSLLLTTGHRCILSYAERLTARRQDRYMIEKFDRDVGETGRSTNRRKLRSSVSAKRATKTAAISSLRIRVLRAESGGSECFEGVTSTSTLLCGESLRQSGIGLTLAQRRREVAFCATCRPCMSEP